MKQKLCKALTILFCLCPTFALAESLSITITPPQTAPVYMSDGTGVNTYLEANRSYACTLTNPYPDTAYILAQSVQSGSSQLNGKYVGEVTPVNTAASTGYVNQSRLSLTPTESGMYSLVINAINQVGSSVAASGSLTCVETTLYGGFNTNINEINYLELANTTNASIKVKIRAVDYDGEVVIDDEEVTVEAGLRKDVDIHSLVGSGKYGALVVMHDGPLGAVKATLSQYKIQSDETLMPTQFSELEPRTNVYPLIATESYYK